MTVILIFFLLSHLTNNIIMIVNSFIQFETSSGIDISIETIRKQNYFALKPGI